MQEMRKKLYAIVREMLLSDLSLTEIKELWDYASKFVVSFVSLKGTISSSRQAIDQAQKELDKLLKNGNGK
jgi:hypothetical protein